MRITAVRPIFVDRYLFVQVAHRRRASPAWASRAPGAIWRPRRAAVETFKRLPDRPGPAADRAPLAVSLPLELTSAARRSWARSAPSTSRCGTSPASTSACPAYQLLGGKCRDKARVYYHVFGRHHGGAGPGLRRRQGAGLHRRRPPDALPRRAARRALLQDPRGQDAATPSRRCGATARRVGDEVDLCIEIHRRLTPAEAIVLARGHRAVPSVLLRRPDPARQLRRHGPGGRRTSTSPSPPASGCTRSTSSRCCSSRGAVQYVRPDVCLAGGLTHSKKIAALAEAHHVGVVPHNPLSPVSTAACLQLAACIPNFALQEYPLGEHEPPKSEIVKTALRARGRLPDHPRRAGHRHRAGRRRRRALSLQDARDPHAAARGRLGRGSVM